MTIYHMIPDVSLILLFFLIKIYVNVNVNAKMFDSYSKYFFENIHYKKVINKFSIISKKPEIEKNKFKSGISKIIYIID